MKSIKNGKIGFLSIIILMMAFNINAQQKSAIKINADGGKYIISRHIYGHFAEHLGRCIYGGFYVGEENNAIPNTNGVRNDIIQALKDIKIPNLRWPGGCFADTYHWKDGIGPKEERPEFVNRWWGDITEDNSFGTNEFLNMCEILDAEPYLSANVGSGTVQELIDWTYYVNRESGNPMAELRKTNGRENPWDVQFWGIGNEAWGCGGNMSADYYADVFRKYSTFMTDWENKDNYIRIASGAAGDDYNWTETIMKNVKGTLIEGMGLHHYSVLDWDAKGPATGFTEAQYFKTMSETWKLNEMVEKHAAIMDKYDPDKKCMLAVDEWGGWYEVEPGTNPNFLFQQNTIRDAMLASMALNIFNNHCDRVKMANLAQTVNVLQAVILTNEEKIIYTPTYHVFKMFLGHHDATLLPLKIEGWDYTVDGKSLPAITASASRDSLGTVHITIVNIDIKNSSELTLDLTGLNAKKVNANVLTSGKIDDHNTFENPEKVKIKTFDDFKLKKDIITIQVPSKSVLSFEIK